MPVPSSTRRGAAVAAFPDVCKTPTPGGPVPIPYPNVASAGAMPAGQAAGKGGTASAVSIGTPSDLLQLRGKLNRLHAQLQALPGSDPNRWHALLEDYVISTAGLYIALAGFSTR